MGKNRWLDTDNDFETKNFALLFLQSIRHDLDTNNFWVDQIKDYRDKPTERLNIALDNIPLPAAFREVAIAIRSIIKEKNNNNLSYEEELHFLYWLAAIRLFMLDHALKLKEPGYNVMESIPAKKIKSLSFNYNELGYKKLELLNKTDCKWFIKAWGEPLSHSTLNELHKDVWDNYENKLIERRKQRDKELQNRF